MQIKLGQMIVVICLLGALQGAHIYASDDGTLQLNPAIMTDSDGGVSISNDFPIRNELFTTRLNEITKAQMQDNISKQKREVVFSEQGTDALYSLDTDNATQKLFIHYEPVVLNTEADEIMEETNMFYWIFVVFAVPLIIASVSLGKRRAKRSVKKQR